MVGGMVLMPLFGAAEGLPCSRAKFCSYVLLAVGKIDFNYMWSAGRPAVASAAQSKSIMQSSGIYYIAALVSDYSTAQHSGLY